MSYLLLVVIKHLPCSGQVASTKLNERLSEMCSYIMAKNVLNRMLESHYKILLTKSCGNVSCYFIKTWMSWAPYCIVIVVLAETVIFSYWQAVEVAITISFNFSFTMSIFNCITFYHLKEWQHTQVSTHIPYLHLQFH